MTVSSDNQFEPNAAAEAAEWFLELQDTHVSPEQQEAFSEWLRRSPVHIEEFLQLTALHGDLGRLLELENLDVDKLLLKLDIRGPEDNVVRLSARRSADDGERQSSARAPSRPRPTPSMRLALAIAVAASLVVVGSWFTGAWGKFFGRQHYRTAVGEQLALNLSDGSHVELNALSSLSATVNSRIRDLQLDDGEALFRVAKDRVHPFRVHTPEATIEAKGTQFNVDVGDDATVVSLLEGHVLVTSGASTILLSPNEQVSIPLRSSGPLQVHAVDMKTVIAWTQHRLVFEDAPLSVVISKFNRYSLQPFIIQDPSLRELRITGSFDIGSAQSFGDSLSAAGAVRVTHPEPGGAYLIGRN